VPLRERTKVIMGAVTAVWPQETEPREGTNTGNPAHATFIPTNLDQGRGDSPPRHHLARHPRHHLAQTTLSPLLEPSFETCTTMLTIRVLPDEGPRRRSCFPRDMQLMWPTRTDMEICSTPYAFARRSPRRHSARSGDRAVGRAVRSLRNDHATFRPRIALANRANRAAKCR
jgi:hypothetical protein